MNDRFPFNLNTDDLSRMTDQAIAMAWYIVQTWPGSFGDPALCDLVERVGHEIINRWLRGAPIPVWRRSGRDYYYAELTRFARWNGVEWVQRTADRPTVPETL